MIYDLPDVDLDVANQEQALSVLRGATLGSQLQDDQLVPHKTGVYLQHIPVDPSTGRAAFPYNVAEAFGFMKIDILPNHVYDELDHQDHLQDLLDAPVDWSWFREVEFVRSLFHFGGMVEQDYSMGDVVAAYAPQSIEDLACLIAIKLPGKKHLIGETWETIRKNIWTREASGLPTFKKSHSVSYAMLVLVDAQLKAPEWFGSDAP